MIYLIYILTIITIIYFCTILYIIIGFIKKEKEDKKIENGDVINKISIIIPIRNEEANIINCLDSLTNQNFKKTNFEVILVNDHSTDNTKSIIFEFIKNATFTILYYELDTSFGKKEALKYGITKATFQIIATTDADCELPYDWIKDISLQFIRDTDMLLGPVMFKVKKGFLSTFQTLDMIAIQGVQFGLLAYNRPILNNAANLSYLKSNYIAVEGFDHFNTPSGDDVFLLEKFKKNKKNIRGLLKENFVVLTNQEISFSGFINQRLRWASKSKFYSDNWLIYFGSITLIQNISVIFICIVTPLVEKYWIILVILLFCKWLIDFILLFLAASFFKRRKALCYFIPVQVVYPIYILFVWIASMMVTFEWKGRRFNE